MRVPSAADALEEGALTIYVDGSMFGNPRRGGMGIRFAWLDDAGTEQVYDESLPSTSGATNNQMELEAPSVALDRALRGRTPVSLSHFKKIVIRTDSAYLHEHLNTALYTWPKMSWKTRDGTAVLNQPDWENLVGLIKRVRQQHRLRVFFEWKKGKVGRHARAVDRLAKQSAKSASFGRARPVVVRRKKTTEAVAADSVLMEGQVLCIRIVQSQFLPRQRSLTRYRYEVDDAGSPHNRRVAWAESEHTLGPGHTYRVRMNTTQRNPRIEEVIEEVVEDLTLYVDTLTALTHPSTASEVAAYLERKGGSALPADAVRRRLEQLVADGKARRTRARSQGSPVPVRRCRCGACDRLTSRLRTHGHLIGVSRPYARLTSLHELAVDGPRGIRLHHDLDLMCG
jgi:ribonuclease HI